MSDYFIPVIYLLDPIGSPHVRLVPAGHAGFVIADGSSGTASYYEYGRYGGTVGKVQSISVQDFNIANIDTVNSDLESVLAGLNYTQNSER